MNWMASILVMDIMDLGTFGLLARGCSVPDCHFPTAVFCQLCPRRSDEYTSRSLSLLKALDSDPVT